VGEMQKSHLLLDDQTIPETTVDYRALLLLDSGHLQMPFSIEGTSANLKKIVIPS
jgi:hypothetical protein